MFFAYDNDSSTAVVVLFQKFFGMVDDSASFKK